MRKPTLYGFLNAITMKKNQISESIIQTICDSFLPDERFYLYTEGFDLIKFCVNGSINKNFYIHIEDLIYHVNNKFDHDMLYSFLNSESKLSYQDYIEKTWSVDTLVSQLINDFIIQADSYLERDLLFILTGVYLKTTVYSLCQIKSFLGNGSHYLYSSEFMSKLIEYNLTFDKFLEIYGESDN